MTFSTQKPKILTNFDKKTFLLANQLLKLLQNCSETAPKLLWNWSEIALKLLWYLETEIFSQKTFLVANQLLKLLRNCSETALKLLWYLETEKNWQKTFLFANQLLKLLRNCSETALKLLWYLETEKIWQKTFLFANQLLKLPRNCSETALIPWNWKNLTKNVSICQSIAKPALKLLWYLETDKFLTKNVSICQSIAETAPKLLWNCSEIALKLLWYLETEKCWQNNFNLPINCWNCSEIAPKLLWNCSDTLKLKIFHKKRFYLPSNCWNCSETALKLLKRFNWILSKNSRLEKGLPWQTCHWMWPASWTACRQTFSNEPECFDRTPRSRRVGPVRWRKDEPSRRRWTCSRRSNAGRERRRPIAAKCSTLPLNAQGSWPRRFLRDGLHPRSARKSPRLSIKFIMISLIHLIFF